MEFESPFPQTIFQADQNKCDGACECHELPCAVVKVSSDDGYAWGFFSYCQNAIRIDKDNGFIVEPWTPKRAYCETSHNSQMG